MAGRVRGLLERLLARRRDDAHGVPDAELLDRFAHSRDEAAFELLVWRHGAMVLGLCRRAVRDEQLAEDAFQAVFLVLARKAGAVRGNLGGWLFKVARRVSLRVAQRRQPVTPSPIETPSQLRPDPVEREELSAILDAEVARLPERLRKPVVLCYLGGQSTEDAARELGCPRGTVLSRLAAARKRLADRLTRRGCTLPAALAGVALSGRMVSQATAAATAFRTGLFTASTTTFLATGVLQTMTRSTLTIALGGTLLATALLGGVAWVAVDQRPKTAAASADANPDTPKGASEPPGAKQTDPDEAEALARRQNEERRRKLEQLAERVRVDTEAVEKNIELLVRANGGRDDVRVALIQKRFAEADAEVAAVGRELTKLEAEAAVLKKRLDDKTPPALDPATIEEAVAGDDRVIKTKSALQMAKATLDNLLISSGGNADHPDVKKEKDRVKASESHLEAERKRAAGEATAKLQAATLLRLRQRLEQIELEIAIKREIVSKLRTERDALQKSLVIGNSTDWEIQRMRDALQPQRELLTRLHAELARM